MIDTLIAHIDAWAPLALVLCCGVALWAAGFFDDEPNDEDDE